MDLHASHSHSTTINGLATLWNGYRLIVSSGDDNLFIEDLFRCLCVEISILSHSLTFGDQLDLLRLHR